MKCDENCFECKYDDCILELKEVSRQMSENTRVKQNAKNREKYQINAVFRANARANAKKQYQKRKARCESDPEYKEKIRAREREYYRRKKARALTRKQQEIPHL